MIAGAMIATSDDRTKRRLQGRRMRQARVAPIAMIVITAIVRATKKAAREQAA